MNKKIWTNIIVLVVIALVLLGGFLFNKARQSSVPDESRIVAPVPEQKSQKEMDLPKKEGEVSEFPSKVVIPEDKKMVILAKVNGKIITSEAFDQELANLSAQYREIFEHDKEELLNQLITREILLQEAERQGLENEKEVQEKIEKDKERRKEILIQELIQGITEEVEVSPQEIRKLYQELKSEIPGKSFQEVKAQLKVYLLQQRRKEKLEAWIEELKSKAKITRNEEWLKAQRMAKMKNPLDEALKKGKPVLADFGRGVCIPCKQMKPVLEELAAEYKEKTSILIIEIDEHPALTRRHHIRLIPTQIFFDAQGKEIYRHEGFMSKKAIKEKFKDMGVK